MKHVIVIKTAENDIVPSSNPSTAEVVAYLRDTIDARQRGGTGMNAVWWMRGVELTDADNGG